MKMHSGGLCDSHFEADGRMELNALQADSGKDPNLGLRFALERSIENERAFRPALRPFVYGPSNGSSLSLKLL